VTEQYCNPSSFGGSPAAKRLAWRLTEVDRKLAKKATKLLQHYLDGFYDIEVIQNCTHTVLNLWVQHYISEVMKTELPKDLKETCISINGELVAVDTISLKGSMPFWKSEKERLEYLKNKATFINTEVK